MAWNFRFPSITSLSMRKKNVNINPPYMSIGQWLSILNLSQYEHLFKKFSGIEVRTDKLINYINKRKKKKYGLRFLIKYLYLNENKFSVELSI